MSEHDHKTRHRVGDPPGITQEIIAQREHVVDFSWFNKKTVFSFTAAQTIFLAGILWFSVANYITLHDWKAQVVTIRDLISLQKAMAYDLPEPLKGYVKNVHVWDIINDRRDSVEHAQPVAEGDGE